MKNAKISIVSSFHTRTRRHRSSSINSFLKKPTEKTFGRITAMVPMCYVHRNTHVTFVALFHETSTVLTIGLKSLYTGRGFCAQYGVILDVLRFTYECFLWKVNGLMPARKLECVGSIINSTTLCM